MDLLEELGLEEKHELVYESVDKEVYAHTVYYEIEKTSYDTLVTDDGKPVANLFTELQQRLYVSLLYNLKWTNKNFMACSNVAFYYSDKLPPMVPNLLLSFNTDRGDFLDKKNKCYFLWVKGKPPELVIEIISNKKKRKHTEKFDIYAKIGVKYYIVHDPFHKLYKNNLQVFKLVNRKYEPYTDNENNYMPEIGLGIKTWKGKFEDSTTTYARWCNKEGEIIFTYLEKVREKERIEELAKNALEEKQRADLESQKAKDALELADKLTQEKLKAEQEIQKLLKQLAASGLQPAE